MATKLILVRHAQPKAPDPEKYPDDAERPLSDEGREIQKAMSAVLKEHEIKPDLILHSPFVRAQQTAAILADAFGAPLEPEDALGATAFNPATLLKRIPDPSKHQTVIMVGHDPTLASFGNALVGQQLLTGGMTKSGAFILEFNETVAFTKGTYITYLQP